MPRHQLAIFDFAGTNADSPAWLHGVLNEVARRHGFREVCDEDREMLRRLSSAEILRHLGVPRWKLPLIARTMRAAARRDIDQNRLFPRVPDLLRDLTGNGVTIAILTSNAGANIRRVLGDAASHVDSAVGGAAFFGEAAKLKSVVRRSAPPPSRIAATGDEVRDVDAARAAGIASLAVTWGLAAPSALEAAAPTRLVRGPAELLAWFRA